MKLRHILALSTTLALTTGSAAYAMEISDIVPASGDTLVVYKQSGDWTVYSDADRGSCLIERSDDDGNAMQMGMTKDLSAVYVGVFTQKDAKIAPQTPIAIAVDGKVYAGESYGVRSGELKGNYSGGYVLSNDPGFVEAIAKGHELLAFPDKPWFFIIDLTGTFKAIEAARECHKSLAN
ncbi:hypothetical protein AAFN47_15210 [Hoeflea sp. CAU 1731]